MAVRCDVLLMNSESMRHVCVDVNICVCANKRAHACNLCVYLCGGRVHV